MILNLAALNYEMQNEDSLWIPAPFWYKKGIGTR
jgi:hypothetical protein